MANPDKDDSRRLVYGWCALLVLSVCIVWLGQEGHELLLTAAVLGVALAKAAVVIEHFMEMRHAPRLWRCLLHAWAWLLALVMFVIAAL